MTHSESIANLAAALSTAQGELAPVTFDRDNPFFHSRYATLTALREAMRPVFARHGLSIIQGAADNGGVETTILHSSGEWLTSAGLPMRPVKDDPQGIGSLITYARRYGLAAAVGLVADEDDDGNGATHGKPPQSPQDAPKPAQAVGHPEPSESPATGTGGGIADKSPCHLYGTMYAPATAATITVKGTPTETADFIVQNGDSGPKYMCKAWGHAADDALAAPAGAAVEIEGSWHVWKDTISINVKRLVVTPAPEGPASEYTDDQIPF